MVKGLKEKDIPEPWFGKKDKPATITPKRTRAASKRMDQQDVVSDDGVEEPSPKAARRDDVGGKGRKKAKGVRPGTIDLVLGRSKYAVLDPEEMSRKRVADANACGRVVKSVSQATTRTALPTAALVGTSTEISPPELVAVGVDNVKEPSRSPDLGSTPVDEGMDTHNQECENTNGVNLGVSPSAGGTPQERNREERQHAPGTLDRGKRKVVEWENVRSTSSERSEDRAEKYRRAEMSSFPMIVKERVSYYPSGHE